MDFVAAGIVLGFSIYEYYKDKIHDNTQTKILSLPRNKKDVVIYRYGGTNPGNLTPSQKDSDTAYRSQQFHLGWEEKQLLQQLIH